MYVNVYRCKFDFLHTYERKTLRPHFCFSMIRHIQTEAYSEPFLTSVMKYFAKIVNSEKPLTIFAKRFIFNVGQGYKYVSVMHACLFFWIEWRTSFLCGLGFDFSWTWSWF